MKVIVVIDGVKSTRSKYNVWSAFEHDDGTISQDTRIFNSDDKNEFIEFMSTINKED
jgi:hypothetical protein